MSCNLLSHHNGFPTNLVFFSFIKKNTVYISAILLGSIKVSYEEIYDRILRVDEEKLTVQMIEQLIKDMPEPEQMNMLAELKGEYNTLAEPEQFGVVVSWY